jgi:hypothetical protein
VSIVLHGNKSSKGDLRVQLMIARFKPPVRTKYNFLL